MSRHGSLVPGTQIPSYGSDSPKVINQSPTSHLQYYATHFSKDINLVGSFPTCQEPAHRLITVTSLPRAVLSEQKSQEIVDLIKERFNETDHTPVAKQKEALFKGDRSNDNHMMSRKMMQAYIGSYWDYFNDQLPICMLQYVRALFRHRILRRHSAQANFLV
jgi:hypothetical protein